MRPEQNLQPGGGIRDVRLTPDVATVPTASALPVDRRLAKIDGLDIGAPVPGLKPNGGGVEVAAPPEVPQRPPADKIEKIIVSGTNENSTGEKSRDGDTTGNWQQAARDPGPKYVTLEKKDNINTLTMTRGLAPSAAKVSPVNTEGADGPTQQANGQPDSAESKKDEAPDSATPQAAGAKSKFYVPVTARRDFTAKGEIQIKVQGVDTEGKLTEFASKHAGNVVVDVRVDPLDDAAAEKARWQTSKTARVHGRNSSSPQSKKLAEQATDINGKVVDATTSGTGLFRTTFAVGADTPEGAKAAADRFATSVVPDPLYPFVLEPGSVPHTSRDAAHAAAASDAPETIHTSAEMGALTSLPTKKELAGIPRVERPEYSVNGVEVPPGTPVATIGSIVDVENNVVGEAQVPLDLVRGGHGLFAGATRQGKTGLIETMTIEVEKANKAELEAGVPLRMSTVVLDEKKEFPTQHWADRRAGANLDGDVVELRPGNKDPNGVYYGDNILEQTEGYSLTKHKNDVIDTFVGAFAASDEGKGGGDSNIETRIFETALHEAIGGTQSTDGIYEQKEKPNLDDLIDGVVESIKRHPEWNSDHTNSVINFLRKNAEKVGAGTHGSHFTAEHTIDWKELIRDGKPVVSNLSALSTSMRPLAAGVEVMKVKQAVEALNNERGPGEPAYGVYVPIDEAIIPSSAVGDRFVEMTSTAAAKGTDSKGGGVYLAFGLQNPDLPKGVQANLNYKVALHTPNAEIAKQMGADMGLDDAQTKHIGSYKPGESAVKLQGQQNGANRVLLTHPDSLPVGEGRVLPPTDYIKTGPAYDGPVTQAVREEAERFRKQEQAGRVHEGYTAIALTTQVKGLSAAHPTGALFDEIKELPESVRREVVAESLTAAVQASEPTLRKEGIDPKELLDHMAPRVQTLVAGDPVSEAPEDVKLGLVAKADRMNPLKRAVHATIPPLDIGIPGENAVAQRAAIDETVEKEVDEQHRPFKTALEKHIKENGLRAPRLPDPDGKWEREYGPIPGSTAGEQRQHLERLKEKAVRDPRMLAEDEWVALAAKRDLIDRHIKASPGLTGDEKARWEKVYKSPQRDGKVLLGADETLPETAGAQLAAIAEREKMLGKAPEFPDLIAPNPSGRNQLEGAVAAVLQTDAPKGNIYPKPDRTEGAISQMTVQNREARWTVGAKTILENVWMDAHTRRKVVEGVVGMVYNFIAADAERREKEQEPVRPPMEGGQN